MLAPIRMLDRVEKKDSSGMLMSCSQLYNSRANLLVTANWAKSLLKRTWRLPFRILSFLGGTDLLMFSFTLT